MIGGADILHAVLPFLLGTATAVDLSMRIASRGFLRRFGIPGRGLLRPGLLYPMALNSLLLIFGLDIPEMGLLMVSGALCSMIAAVLRHSPALYLLPPGPLAQRVAALAAAAGLPAKRGDVCAVPDDFSLAREDLRHSVILPQRYFEELSERDLEALAACQVCFRTWPPPYPALLWTALAASAASGGLLAWSGAAVQIRQVTLITLILLTALSFYAVIPIATLLIARKAASLTGRPETFVAALVARANLDGIHLSARFLNDVSRAVATYSPGNAKAM
jgi:hypothetical protein